jgi:membrane fusion protein, multidrug efflux system
VTLTLAAGCTPARTYRFLTAFAWVLASALALIRATPVALADQAIPVVVETVRTLDLVNDLELSGTVTSPRVSQISVAVPGRVQSVHYDSGARVEANDVLLELDPALEKIAIRQADAEIAQAEAELADAKRRLGIAENLAKRSFGPQNAVDQIKTEVATKTAAIERTKAQRASAAERLDRHYVKAPYSGIISQKMAEAGQWIVPGTTVFELVDMSGLRIDVPVPQQYYPQLRSGADLSVRFDALPDTTLPARVGALIPVSDPSVRTFTLRVLPDNADLSITPGMSARVSISLQSGRKGLVVSRDALVRYPDGRITVWVLEDNGDKSLVKERRIEIGNAFDGQVHVRSGLKEGERVVVRGNESLREGQSVRLAS